MYKIQNVSLFILLIRDDHGHALGQQKKTMNSLNKWRSITYIYQCVSFLIIGSKSYASGMQFNFRRHKFHNGV